MLLNAHSALLLAFALYLCLTPFSALKYCLPGCLKMFAQKSEKYSFFVHCPKCTLQFCVMLAAALPKFIGPFSCFCYKTKGKLISLDSKSQSKLDSRQTFFRHVFLSFLIFCIIFISNSIKSINVIHIIFTVAMTSIIVMVTVMVTWHSIWSNHAQVRFPMLKIFTLIWYTHIW